MNFKMTALLAGSSLSSLFLMAGGEAIAQTTQPQQFAQVTSVSELSDVQPTEWYFQALQSLVERYGCIAGYPDGTFRGQRAMTRGEFAAGLNACLDRINELIAAGLADKVSREDLATVQRLQEEFAAELAALTGRVDALEATTAELEANPLGLNTATSKLGFEIITGVFGASSPDGTNNASAPYRVRPRFDVSFTGDDFLRVQLQARESFAFDGDPVGLGKGETPNTDETVILDDAFYRFPLFNGRVTGLVGISGIQTNIQTNFANILSGGISDLAELDFLLTQSGFLQDTTLSFSWSVVEDVFFLNYAYSSGEGAGNDFGEGLFAGETAHLVELAYIPIDSLTLVAQYANYAQGEGGGTPVGAIPGDAQAVSVGVNWEITSRIAFQGTYSRGFFEEDVDDTNDFVAGLTFRDFFIEGSNAGFLVGSPNTNTTSLSFADDGEDLEEFPLQFEAWYGFPLTDNITITPGVYYITNVDNDGEDIIVGGVETIFRF